MSLVQHSHSHDLLNMEYARRRVLNAALVQFGLNLISLLSPITNLSLRQLLSLVTMTKFSTLGAGKSN